MSAATAAAFKILAIGPNPALQKVMSFDSPVQIGGVNRASQVATYVGGKGQGVALALERYSPGCSAVAQFLGGDTGKYVEEQLTTAGVEQLIQATSAPTRTCTTLLAGGQGGGTELIDPSGRVAEAELDGLLDKLDTYCESTSVGGLALCGTTPPGAASLYASLANQLDEQTSDSPPILLLDGHKQVEQVLCSGRVDVLKINVDEARALTAMDRPRDCASRLLEGSGALLRRPGAMLALTDGPNAARLFLKGGGAFTFRVPVIECVNAIGAGDVCTAIFLHELVVAARAGKLNEDSAADAFAMGLAAACARCTHELPTAFDREEVNAMRGKIQVEKNS